MTKIRVGGAEKDIASMKVMVGGGLKEVSRAQIQLSSGLKVYFSSAPPMTLAITGTPFAVAQSTTLTTGAVTATPTGGQGPFTYLWELVSTTAPNNPTISSPSMSATTFTLTNVQAGAFFTAEFRCTATDSFGSTAQATVQATFTHIDIN